MKSELKVIDPESGEESSCASVLKILADETRLGVVERLLDGPLNVAEINEHLQVEPTLLSHHLKVLRESHLVEVERQGKHLVYRLSSALLARRRGRALDLGCCKLSFQ